jgi:hypothetical protein
MSALRFLKAAMMAKTVSLLPEYRTEILGTKQPVLGDDPLN